MELNVKLERRRGKERRGKEEANSGKWQLVATCVVCLKSI